MKIAWFASRVAIAYRMATNVGANLAAANVRCAAAVAVFVAPSVSFLQSFLQIFVEFALIDLDLPEVIPARLRTWEAIAFCVRFSLHFLEVSESFRRVFRYETV